MSAYQFFTKDQREAAKSKLGKTAKVTAVMKELAAMWKGCPAKERKKYQAMADKARDEYLVAIEKWRKDKKNKKAEPKKAKKASKKSKVGGGGLRV